MTWRSSQAERQHSQTGVVPATPSACRPDRPGSTPGQARVHARTDQGPGPWVTGATLERQHFFDAKDISIPFAISVFPDELYQAPRSWAERAYPDNLIHYNKLDRGGHFAAWEQPQLFSEELRAAFRSLRT